MAVNVAMTFDPAQEEADGKGWILSIYDDTVEAPPTTATYATYTMAAAAQKVSFQNDPTVTAFFQDKAEAQVLATQAAAVNTARTTLRTAEGL